MIIQKCQPKRICLRRLKICFEDIQSFKDSKFESLNQMVWSLKCSFCQAQPKVQTKASAFGWDGYNIIIIQPPTHPPGRVWRRRDRAKLRKRKLFQKFNNSTIQPLNNLTTQHFNTSTIQQFNNSTIQRLNTSTIQHFNNSTIQEFETSTI